MGCLTALRLCRNPRKRADVMLPRAKHLAFSRCYEDEILRLRAQNDIATQSRFRGNVATLIAVRPECYHGESGRKRESEH